MLGGTGILPPAGRGPRKREMIFSEDELAHLATLSGKEKKRYVRELKSRYTQKSRELQASVTSGTEVALLSPSVEERHGNQARQHLAEQCRRISDGKQDNVMVILPEGERLPTDE